MKYKKLMDVLPPSKSLIMKREDVQKSAFICPSGAQLEWEKIFKKSSRKRKSKDV